MMAATSTDDNNQNNNNNNNSTTKQIHWCIIGRHAASKTSRRYFWHFPHASEMLLPCWSWWRRWDAVDQCGLILLDGLLITPKSWQHQLVNEHWNCQIKTFEAYDASVNRTHPLVRYLKSDEEQIDTNIYYTPSLYWKNPRHGRINYFERPDDAWALRRRFISDDDIVAQKQQAGNNIHIGILQRSKSRRITNLDEIVILLQHDIPDANITVVTELPSALGDQAAWFATKDIIIGAHGAAMMNCLFILPKTIVMQLYPEHYFFQSLEPLIEGVGGIALDWYVGTTPHYDWMTSAKLGKNNVVREQNITPPAHQIVDPILFTMGRKPTPSGWANPLGVMGTNWSKSLNWMG
jgi:hypothetical protein